MAKAIVITLSVDCPDTVVSKTATVTIGEDNYGGTVTAVMTYEEPAKPAPSQTVTLSAQGLQVVTPSATT